jgi:hypothetical protein
MQKFGKLHSKKKLKISAGQLKAGGGSSKNSTGPYYKIIFFQLFGKIPRRYRWRFLYQR